jgi:hypothetical protein
MTAALQPANDGLHPRSRPTSRNKLALIDAAWVCHHLPELADLTQADKAILCALIRHIDQGALDAGKSTVWPSTLCLALDTGYTQRQVMRSLARMEARQLIRRFTPPRWRTAHTDLNGFMALAADVLDAHADEKDRQIQPARGAPIAVLVDDTESYRGDTESSLTETDIGPAIPVEQSDAARRQIRRRPNKSAATDGDAAQTTTGSTNGQAQTCSPSRAGFSARAQSEPSIPAEMPRAALSAAWEASPTLRRLVDVDQLQTAPLGEVAAAVERDYLATVTGIRNPHHIWAWAVNRHGLANTVLGWLIACDTPPSAGRPERNPGGWFTRFATAERPWNLARNLRQLGQAARRPPAPVAPELTPAATIHPEAEPAAPNPEAAASALAAFRSAWIQTLTQRIGAFRAESVWKSWLSQAIVTGVEDDRLQIRVRGKATPGHLYEKFDDVCRIAAQAVGYEGVDFFSGTSTG